MPGKFHRRCRGEKVGVIINKAAVSLDACQRFWCSATLQTRQILLVRFSLKIQRFPKDGRLLRHLPTHLSLSTLRMPIHVDRTRAIDAKICRDFQTFSRHIYQNLWIKLIQSPTKVGLWAPKQCLGSSIGALEAKKWMWFLPRLRCLLTPASDFDTQRRCARYKF